MRLFLHQEIAERIGSSSQEGETLYSKLSQETLRLWLPYDPSGLKKENEMFNQLVEDICLFQVHYCKLQQPRPVFELSLKTIIFQRQ